MSSSEAIPARTALRRFPRFLSVHAWILNRYLVVELLPPLSMGLFLFAVALMLIATRDVLDVILLSGAPAGPIFKSLVCIFPPMLTTSLPIGCLLASLLVYGRLVEDRELTAMRAAGVNTFAMVIPSLFLGLCLTGFNFYWTSYVTPKAVDLMRQAQWEIVQNMTSINWLKPGQFTALQENDLAFYFTGSEPGTNNIHDITIFKSGVSSGNSLFGQPSGDESASNRTVSAPTATLVPDPARGILKITLHQCNSEDLRPEKLNRVQIKQATISIDIGRKLAKMMGGFSKDQKSWRDLRVSAESAKNRYEDLRTQLGFPEGTRHGVVIAKAKEWVKKEQEHPGCSPLKRGIVELGEVKANIEGVQTNTNRAMLRLAYPAATFVFMMVGTALGILTGRGNRTVCILVTVGVLIFFYAVQKIAEAYSENYALTHSFDPGIAVWTPNIVLFLLGVVLLAMVSRQ